MTSAEGFTKFKIDYDLQGKDPREIERLIQSAVDEVMAESNIKPAAVKIHPPKKQTKWELTLETAPDSPPCNTPVVVIACGVKGDDDPTILSTPHDGSKPFQPGQSDVFDIEVDKEIGDIFKLRLGFPKNVQRAQWKMKSLKLRHPRNRDTFSTDSGIFVKTSPTQDPWQEVYVIWPDYPLLPVVEYRVSVYTSPKSGEMNSGADVVLYGDYGNSGKRSMRSTGQDKFQPGGVDEFVFPVVHLGQVRQVRIINDLSGEQTAWMIDKVVVKDNSSSKEWTFPCGRYFDPNKGDHKHDRIVLPGKESEEEEEEKPKEPEESEPEEEEPPPPPKRKSERIPEPEQEPMDMPQEERPAPSKPAEKKPAPQPEKKKPTKQAEPEQEPMDMPEEKKKPPPQSKPKDMPREPPPKKKEEPKQQKPDKEPPKGKTPPQPKYVPPGEHREHREPPQPDPADNDWLIWWVNRGHQRPYDNVQLTFTVVGDRGTSEPITIENDMRPGESDKRNAYFDLRRVGEIEKVRFRFSEDTKNTGMKWEIAKLCLQQVRTSDIHTFEFDSPIVQKENTDPTVEASFKGDPVYAYQVELHTGDRDGLFLPDVQARINLRGTEGSSGDRMIINAAVDGRLKLRQYEILKYEVQCADLGNVRGIAFKHNKKDKQTADFVEKIVVRPLHNPQEECMITFQRKKPETPMPKPTPKPHESDQLWHLWWENYDNQQPIPGVTVGFIVVGAKESSRPFDAVVDLKPGNSTKKRLEFDGSKLGAIEKVRVKFPEDTPKGTAWDIHKMHLLHVKSAEIHTFEFEKPVLKKAKGDPTVEASCKGVPISIYEVEIHTGDRDGLFEDDVRAKILIRGTNNDTGDRIIVDAPAEGRLKIRQGDVIKFDVDSVDIGAIKGIAFKHNKPGMQTADFVSKIVVRPTHKKEAEFSINFDWQKQAEAPQPDPEASPKLWNIWWENRKSQEIARRVTLGFTVVGESDSTRPFDFTVDLKPGESDKKVVEFDGSKIGLIDKVRVKFADEVARQTKWEIEKLHLLHVQTGELHTFEFEKPAVKKDKGDSTIEASIKGIPLSIYEVELHTADREGLFEDDVRAKVLVRGKAGDTGERTVVNAPVEGPLKLRRGEVIKFEIEGVDIGVIKGVQFTHNKVGRDPGDFIERIIVRPTHLRSAEYCMDFNRKFPVNRWQIWWENRDAQVSYQNVGLSFMIVGDNGNSDSFDVLTTLMPGESERYDIEFDSSELGEIDKVRVRFADAVKYKTKWDIAKLHLLRRLTGEKHTFEFDKPAVKKEGDSTFEASNRGEPLTVHLVELHLGNRKGMYATKDVIAKVIVRGEKGDSGKRTAFNGNDESAPQLGPNMVIKCEVESVDIGDVRSVQFIHNKAGKTAGDFLSKIVVRPLHLENVEYVFEYEQGMVSEKAHVQEKAPPAKAKPQEKPEESPEEKPRDEGPGISVEQLEPEANADPRLWVISWNNYDNQQIDRLQISVVLFGEKRESAPYLLDVDLSPGESKEYSFMVKEDVGELVKLRFGHGPKTRGDHPWKVQEVRMKHVATGSLHRFRMGAPAKKPSATTAPKYRVEVYMRRSATDIGSRADIYIRLKGVKLVTEKCWLNNSLNNPVRFKPGQMDVFEIDDAPDVGEVVNITFGGPDERAVAALRSYVTKVVVVPLHWRTRKEFVFNFNNESPAPSAASAPTKPWTIKVKTGNFKKSKTMMPLSLAVCGRQKTSELVSLKQSTGFVQNQVHTFKAELEEIDEVFKIRIGFLDYFEVPMLFIEEIYLEMQNGPQYSCQVGEWVWASPKQDGWREFLVKKTKLQLQVFKYQMAVWTGAAGLEDGDSSATVYAELFGSRGDTGKRRLANSKSHVHKFVPNQMDIFDIEAVDIGDVKKLLLTISPKEANARWQPARILLQTHPLGGEEFLFDCNRILDANNKSAAFQTTIRNPGRPYERSSPEEYLVFVSTGPDPEMATQATVSLSVFGDRGASPVATLVKPNSPITANSTRQVQSAATFRSGNVDSFVINIPAKEVGTIIKTRIEHNNMGQQRGWFLDKFSIQNLAKPREYTLHFDVLQWLSGTQEDGEIVRECPAYYFEKPAAVKLNYEITIMLGSKTSASVPSNVTVYIELLGKSQLTSGKRNLLKSMDDTPYLQPNDKSVFHITAVGVGEVNRVAIGHDAPDINFQLEIDSITVEWSGAIKGRIDFPVNKLLAKPHPSKDAEIIVGNSSAASSGSSAGTLR